MHTIRVAIEAAWLAYHVMPLNYRANACQASATVDYQASFTYMLPKHICKRLACIETVCCTGRLGLIGDLGQTDNSAQTLDHLTASNPGSVINVGDLSYADGYQPRSGAHILGQPCAQCTLQLQTA